MSAPVTMLRDASPTDGRRGDLNLPVDETLVDGTRLDTQWRGDEPFALPGPTRGIRSP